MSEMSGRNDRGPGKKWRGDLRRGLHTIKSRLPPNITLWTAASYSSQTPLLLEKTRHSRHFWLIPLISKGNSMSGGFKKPDITRHFLEKTRHVEVRMTHEADDKRRGALIERPEDLCTVLDGCDQCGRRAPQLHVSGNRAYCSRCCPCCAPLANSHGVEAGERLDLPVRGEPGTLAALTGRVVGRLDRRAGVRPSGPRCVASGGSRSVLGRDLREEHQSGLPFTYQRGVQPGHFASR